MILSATMSRDLISMAQASDLVENGITLLFPKSMASSYKTLPSPYRVVATEMNRTTVGFNVQFVMLGYIWDVQICHLVYLLVLMSFTVLIAERIDHVPLLNRAVFTNSIVQSENGKLAAWFTGAELRIFGCEWLSPPVAGLSYGSSDPMARLFHEASIIRYSSVGCFLVLHMDSISSKVYEIMQRVDKKFKPRQATSFESHIPTLVFDEAFRRRVICANGVLKID